MLNISGSRKNGFSKAEFANRLIDSPDEDVRIGARFVGRVVGRSVTVEAGVVADVDVEASETVVVEGRVRGAIRARVVRVAVGGEVDGEIHADDVLDVAGRVDGLPRARQFVVRKGATVRGCAIAGRFGCEADAIWMASVVSGPGCFENADLLRQARESLGVPSGENPYAAAPVGESGGRFGPVAAGQTVAEATAEPSAEPVSSAVAEVRWDVEVAVVERGPEVVVGIAAEPRAAAPAAFREPAARGGAKPGDLPPARAAAGRGMEEPRRRVSVVDYPEPFLIKK